MPLEREKNLGSLSRRERVKRSRQKVVPPYLLDGKLTFYCPQENLASLKNSIVAEFHRHVAERYRPPEFPGRTTLLILPCTRTKPYNLSTEHQAINGYLDGLKFRPLTRFQRPADLGPPKEIPQALLKVSPLRKGTRVIHRMVISEPMALVPYEYLYFYKRRISPVSRYDDPGLFEHRRNAVCLWRKDSTAKWGSNGYSWGENELKAYVLYHNALVDLITRTLVRLRPCYDRVVAYVSPKLTHRSFLTSREEKRANGMPIYRKVAGARMELLGVNDIEPGLVEVLPRAKDFAQARAQLARRLRRKNSSVSDAQVQAYFARGGGGGTPLMLPEVLKLLKPHLS